MRFTTLDEWLNWQTSLHPREIELVLDRCYIIAQRLNTLSPAFPIITVAGTNGKGSSVILLDAILSAAGYCVGRFTSPHLLRYNERICIAGQEITDTQLCNVFNLIEEVRDNISLTFFEYSTLAAMLWFQQNNVDLAILEVGMGGRLDAVNVFEPTIAIVTTIDIDHVDWLGDNRESIGFEKAGIFRAQRPAVCSDASPPQSLMKHAEQLQAPLYYQGNDFTYHKDSDTQWSWQFRQEQESITYTHLPRPSLPGDFQLQNAAGVLMVLKLLSEQLAVPKSAIYQGLINAKLNGRLQVLPGQVTRILDVAHNPLGAQVLAQSICHLASQGETHAVVGMLQNKDITGVFTQLQTSITHWHVAPLNTPRGANVQHLIDKLTAMGVRNIYSYPSVARAYTHLLAHVSAGDRIVVFGSFFTVSEVLQLEKNSEFSGMDF